MDVLIVNDETAILDLLAEVIEDAGYHAVRATNGSEALIYLQQCATLPCVILTDLMMPVMDDVTFRTQQLQDPRLADISVIACGRDQAAPWRCLMVYACAGGTVRAGYAGAAATQLPVLHC